MRIAIAIVFVLFAAAFILAMSIDEKMKVVLMSATILLAVAFILWTLITIKKMKESIGAEIDSYRRHALEVIRDTIAKLTALEENYAFNCSLNNGSNRDVVVRVESDLEMLNLILNELYSSEERAIALGHESARTALVNNLIKFETDILEVLNCHSDRRCYLDRQNTMLIRSLLSCYFESENKLSIEASRYQPVRRVDIKGRPGCA